MGKQLKPFVAPTEIICFAVPRLPIQYSTSGALKIDQITKSFDPKQMKPSHQHPVPGDHSLSSRFAIRSEPTCLPYLFSFKPIQTARFASERSRCPHCTLWVFKPLNFNNHLTEIKTKWFIVFTATENHRNPQKRNWVTRPCPTRWVPH